MQTVACPSCGAQVEFKSRASVMAVCGFCKSSIVKDADSVKDIGKMSDVLQDYSPIQLGTAGQYDGVAFDVIGRIQLRYPGGMWNEWYLLFADGHNGWLSDASAQYAVTSECAPGAEPIPSFDSLRIGQRVALAGTVGIAADIRSAQCVGGQGELPFRVGAGWLARVVDLRRDDGFLTIDYSDPVPKLYRGRSVSLDALKPQLLRDDAAVRDSAGKLTSPVARLACPSCGASVPVVAGLTVRSICPSCHQRLDTNTNITRALEAGARMERTPSTLDLGANATISGTTYELIGLLHRRDADGERWTEYLLYHPRAGLLWLIETDDGWYQAKVQDIWPNWDGATVATLDEKRFTQIASYRATVEFAAGAFNWQVSAGDTVEIVEFEAGRARLAMERNAEEMTWSLATQVPPDMLSAWLGKALKTPLRAASPHRLRTVAIWFLIALAVANAIPFMFANDDTWLALGLAAAAIYFPAKWLEPSLEDDA